MKIFLSHAKVNEKIADAICTLLGDGLNVVRKNIFCSSLPGQSIPGGFNFVEHIKAKLVESDVVVSVLTQNYLDREFCLAELGACWILEKRVIPLVVAPLTYSSVKATLSLKQAWRINDADDLNSFAEDLLSKVEPAQWGYAAKKFLDKINVLLSSQPKPEKIAYIEYQKMEDWYNRVLQERDKLNEELDIQIQKNEQLKACKDFQQVSDLELKYSTEGEQFEKLIEITKEQLCHLPQVVKEALYYENKGENLPYPDAFDDSRKGYIKDAVDQKLLFWEDDKPINVNYNHPTLKNIRDELRKLDSFLEHLTQNYRDTMESKHRFTFALDDKQFWDKFLF